MGELPVIRSAADIHLPLDAYIGTPRERLTITAARLELVSRCMAERGYPGYPSRDLSSGLLQPMHDNRFSIVSEEQARTDGFTPAWMLEQEVRDNAGLERLIAWDSPEVRAALHGTVRPTPPSGPGSEHDAAPEAEGPPASASPRPSGRTPEELYGDPDGCHHQAYRELMELTGRENHDRTWIESAAEHEIVKAEEDDRLEPAAAAWAACMQQAGYDYQHHLDPLEDERLEGRPDEEKVVALATVRCLHSSRYLETLIALATAYQERFIEKNAERLADEKDFKERTLAAIAAQGLGRIEGNPGGPPPGD